MLTPLLIASTVALGADCEAPVKVDDMVAALTAAEAAYAAMDVDTFRASRATAQEAIPCLAAQLSPMDAGMLHRMDALEGYLAKDQERTVASFRSSLAVQPAYVLPSTIAPEGNLLYTLYSKAREAGPGAEASVDLPMGTALYVDGARKQQRPMERPAILQVVGPDGSVVWTGLVAAGDSPDWSGVDMPDPVTEPPPPAPSHDLATAPVPEEKNGLSLPLLAGAGGAAVISGAVYALAWSGKQAYVDRSNPDIHTNEDLAALRQTTNTKVYVSAATGAVAVGLGAVAFLQFTW